MKFKKPELEQQLHDCHPETVEAAFDLGSWILERGWPDLLITDVFRTDDEQEAIYWPGEALKRIHAIQDDELAVLSRAWVDSYLDPKKPRPEAPPAVAEALDAFVAETKLFARNRFSWHKVSCAWDWRNRLYTPVQRKQIVDRLKRGRSSPMWEILEHDVGNGNHGHVARRDFAWRKNFRKPAAEGGGNG